MPDASTQVTIYTDGACLGNPGPGGFGVVLISGTHRKELAGGYRKTTNNRMELMGAIVALRSLKHRCIVTLHTDSRYVADPMTNGRAKVWRAKGWMRTRKEPAKNADLWAQLLEEAEKHDVTFQWVRGHAGNKENERCDALSVAAANEKDMPADEAFEEGATRGEGLF
ncbi:MAG: ribonuclease HI [Phycisphaeraceae bacterium]